MIPLAQSHVNLVLKCGRFLIIVKILDSHDRWISIYVVTKIFKVKYLKVKENGIAIVRTDMVKAVQGN
jgi:hypothetical protein